LERRMRAASRFSSAYHSHDSARSLIHRFPALNLSQKRIAGNSGPQWKDIQWDFVGQRAGDPTILHSQKEIRLLAVLEHGDVHVVGLSRIKE
ncbi:MAG: hypothetical protein QGI11_16660, partial [Nitrospinota bacterium]|nr:hypothetical protein [Nitrospinota bacterium]